VVPVAVLCRAYQLADIDLLWSDWLVSLHFRSLTPRIRALCVISYRPSVTGVELGGAAAAQIDAPHCRHRETYETNDRGGWYTKSLVCSGIGAAGGALAHRSITVTHLPVQPAQADTWAAPQAASKPNSEPISCAMPRRSCSIGGLRPAPLVPTHLQLARCFAQALAAAGLRRLLRTPKSCCGCRSRRPASRPPLRRCACRGPAARPQHQFRRTSDGD
jgi:hypothetical protein